MTSHNTQKIGVVLTIMVLVIVIFAWFAIAWTMFHLFTD